jgi:hypothetical protein
MSNALRKVDRKRGVSKINKDIIARLSESLTATSSLDDLLKAHQRRNSMLLVDVSGSMDESLKNGDRKITALREVVSILRETNPVPVAAFGGGHAPVKFVDAVPEPTGGTPLHLGIEFSQDAGATHIVVVTDGAPDSKSAALDAARRFAKSVAMGGVIDVFYVGDGNDGGAEFCEMLASVTGGAANVTDLEKPKELAAKIAGYLPASV